MDQPRVLVFDSGVGGLSIYQGLRERCPACQLVYLCDNEAFPYGTKGEEELAKRVLAVITALYKVCPVDAVVVACNTASTLVLAPLRQAFTIPVVGVVPAIKPAAQMSLSKVIGLLATPGTVSRPYTAALVRDFASDCQVIMVGSAALVHMAEDKVRGKKIPIAPIQAILAAFTGDTRLDTVVLGCTHFPLLADELRAALPQIKNWVDSTDAVCRQTENVLVAKVRAPLQAPAHNYPLAFLTKLAESEHELKHAFASFGFMSVQHLQL